MTPETKRTIEREVTLHKYLKHKHVIRQYGSRYHEPLNCQFIFMEYAEGGELFDKLVPDVGMPEKEAQNYFRQLICGVQFLHSKVILYCYIFCCRIFINATFDREPLQNHSREFAIAI